MTQKKKVVKKTAKPSKRSRINKKRIDKRLETVTEQQKEQKELLIKQLEKIPIVELAIKKSSISRSTYYRWMGEDTSFKRSVKEAHAKGLDYMNDVAESKLIQKVHNGDTAMVKYWLNHNAKRYGAKHAPEIYIIADNIPQEKINEITQRVQRWKKTQKRFRLPNGGKDL